MSKILKIPDDESEPKSDTQKIEHPDWYDAYGKRRSDGQARAKTIGNTAPAREVWEKIDGMCLHEFVGRCSYSMIDGELVIGLRKKGYS